VIKAEFSASLLQSSVSHDPSEVTLVLICCYQHIFLETMMHIFSGLFNE